MVACDDLIVRVEFLTLLNLISSPLYYLYTPSENSQTLKTVMNNQHNRLCGLYKRYLKQIYFEFFVILTLLFLCGSFGNAIIFWQLLQFWHHNKLPCDSLECFLSEYLGNLGYALSLLLIRQVHVVKDVRACVPDPISRGLKGLLRG